MLDIETAINQNLWKRVIIRCIILFFTALFLVFAAPKLFHLLLPFLIALLVARLLHPLVEAIHQKFRIPIKIAAVIFDVLIFLVVFSLLGLLVSYFIQQLVELVTSIQRNWGQITVGFQQGKNYFTWLMQSLPPEVIHLFQGYQSSLMSALQSGNQAAKRFLILPLWV